MRMKFPDISCKAISSPCKGLSSLISFIFMEKPPPKYFSAKFYALSIRPAAPFARLPVQNLLTVIILLILRDI